MKTCFECRKRFPLESLISVKDVFVCEICKPIIEHRLEEYGSVIEPLQPAGFIRRIVAFILDLLFVLIFGAFSFWIFIFIGLPFITWVVWAINNLHPIHSDFEFGNDKTIENMLIYGLFSMTSLFYFVYFVGKEGATFGKRILKIKIIRMDETPIGYYLALGRYFAHFLSFLTLGIGHIMIVFDRKNAQSLHDRICKTRVVHVNLKRNPFKSNR